MVPRNGSSGNWAAQLQSKSTGAKDATGVERSGTDCRDWSHAIGPNGECTGSNMLGLGGILEAPGVSLL